MQKSLQIILLYQEKCLSLHADSDVGTISNDRHGKVAVMPALHDERHSPCGEIF
jgi:hypothetical protein